MLSEKKCAICKEIKTKEKFYNNRANKDGLSYYCIPCTKRKYYNTKKMLLRKKVLNKYNNACAICKSKDKLVLHHVIPRTKGGKDVEWNLIVLCKDCHLKHRHKNNFNFPNGKCLEFLKL